MSPESIFEFRAPSPPGVVAAHTTPRSAQKWQCFLQPTSLEMRCTVPVPSPSDLATFKMPTPLRKLLSHLAFGCAVDLRSAELHALGDGTLEPCFDPLADHRPLKLSKGAS